MVEVLVFCFSHWMKEKHLLGVGVGCAYKQLPQSGRASLVYRDGTGRWRPGPTGGGLVGSHLRGLYAKALWRRRQYLSGRKRGRGKNV